MAKTTAANAPESPEGKGLKLEKKGFFVGLFFPQNPFS